MSSKIQNSTYVGICMTARMKVTFSSQEHVKKDIACSQRMLATGAEDASRGCLRILVVGTEDAGRGC